MQREKKITAIYRSLAAMVGSKGSYLNNQKGFAISMVLGAIVLLGIFATAMVFAGRGSKSDVGTQAVRMQSSVVLQQGTNVYDAFTAMVGKGVSIDTITFDATANSGLFHPVDGTAIPQTAPSDVMAAAGITWKYKKNVKIKSVGQDAGEDYIIALPNIKQAHCWELNKSLGNAFNDSSSRDNSIDAGLLAHWNGTDAIDMSAIALNESKYDACIKLTAGQYVYYKVIAAN